MDEARVVILTAVLVQITCLLAQVECLISFRLVFFSQSLCIDSSSFIDNRRVICCFGHLTVLNLDVLWTTFTLWFKCSRILCSTMLARMRYHYTSFRPCSHLEQVLVPHLVTIAAICMCSVANLGACLPLVRLSSTLIATKDANNMPMVVPTALSKAVLIAYAAMSVLR